MSATTRRLCPECEGRLRSTDTETVCDDCGLVVDETARDRVGAVLEATTGMSVDVGENTESLRDRLPL